MHWRRQRHEFHKQKQSLILTTHCKTYRCHWCKQKKYCRFVQDGSFHVPFGCQMLFRLCWHWTTKFITSIEAHEFDTWGYGPMYIYVYHSRHKWWWFQYRTFESESFFFGKNGTFQIVTLGPWHTCFDVQFVQLLVTTWSVVQPSVCCYMYTVVP